MSTFRYRYARFPRQLTELRRSGGLRGLGQPPNTRDVSNALPMPAQPPGMDTKELPRWLYPPINWENVDQLAYVNLPALNTEVDILSITVPIGRNGIINKVACNFVGGGWVAGSGDVQWRILIDGAPPPGAVSYDTILDSLGAITQPTGISGFRVFENQTVKFRIFNNPGGANGGVVVAGQKIGARLMGYWYPRATEDANIWI